jgi:LuxR family transcriptional regulator, maltose regulon positive regulatory protein
MAQKTPCVYDRWLPVPTGNAPEIRLDSPAWFEWLDAPTTMRFAYPIYDRRCGYIVGVMTVRKESRQRGGWYWTAYRRVGAKLHKHYLGRSATVTQMRLTTIAAQLLAEVSLATRDSSPETPGF